MATQVTPAMHGDIGIRDRTAVRSANPALQAFWILRIAFTVAPIVAGADKFGYRLTDWSQYLAPRVPEMLKLDAPTFMKIVGVVEIVAGIGVALFPRVFGYVVAAWMLGIIVNLLMIPGFYDIALRDLGLALGALALARLASARAKDF
ncbi:MAG TPA: hypothetical protein VM509_03495 [Planctomycetota bacterium]|nr:hypothetical protein [Planctomycetota bacterium]